MIATMRDNAMAMVLRSGTRLGSLATYHDRAIAAKVRRTALPAAAARPLSSIAKENGGDGCEREHEHLAGKN